MIFVTVGSAYPFDRLVRACDEIAAGDHGRDWLAQIHSGTYEPTHMRFERFMSKERFDAAIAEAEMIVGHAGIGTISSALALGKPLLVVPRRKAHGESVNDHQVPCAEHFRAGGHLLVADQADQLGAAFESLGPFVPVPRRVQANRLADAIGAFLGTC